MPRACSAPPGKLAAVGDAAEEWADQEVRGFETVLLPRTLDLLEGSAIILYGRMVHSDVAYATQLHTAQ